MEDFCRLSPYAERKGLPTERADDRKRYEKAGTAAHCIGQRPDGDLLTAAILYLSF